jgi:hypothetical protein
MKNASRHRLGGEFCTYCGLMADSEEHFPPQSWSDKGVILPACRECNTIASNIHPVDFWQRVDRMKRLLRQRYDRDLRIPKWSPQELASLGTSLRGSIKEGERRREIIAARLSWDVRWYLGIIGSDPPSRTALEALGIAP